MSILGSLFNQGVNPNANSTGVTSNLNTGGTQRSFFLQPDVMASSLSPTLSNLNIKGQSKSLDANGNKYPTGFTPDVDYYENPKNLDPISGFPVERGVIPSSGVVDKNGKPLFGLPRDVNGILDNDVVDAYDAFNADENWEYLHHLDKGDIPINLKLTSNTDIYLSSFVETDTDNEDPVSFGYDLIINYDTSPLFNGAIPDFINSFPSYTELSSRLDLYKDFTDQFFKFFKIDAQNLLGLDLPRTYYLQKISGLDNLTESISSDKWKQFVDYGKDFITLTLREDVSVNTGYISALYKLLSWSRLNGKKMIPDNLLRFDMEIVVTEARKFNRVRKNSDNTLDQFADLLSRYRYQLYECQFFFEKMSHGNEIDMTNLGYNDNYDIKINYKYSNLLFEKFTDDASVVVGTSIIRPHVEIDNSTSDLGSVNPINTSNFSLVNNTIVLNPVDYVLNKYSPNGQNSTYYPINLGKNSTFATSSSALDLLNKTSTTPNQYQAKLGNMNIPTAVTSISNQDTLLQKTLQNIESTFMSDVNRTIYGLEKAALSFIPTNFIGGFTDDGYQYNIPAYLINKSFNTSNNSLLSAISSIRTDIYAQADLFVTEVMNFVDNGVSSPSLSIYGNPTNTPIVYSGSQVSSDNFPDTPAHNTGTPLDIYSYEPTYTDTPPHDMGAPLDIYSYEPNYPDDPPHTTGAPLDIYSYEPNYPDNPPHTTGAPLDIYSYEPTYPDTPPHDTGAPLDIYSFEPNYPDDPPHTTGAPLDIYSYEPNYPYDPPHNTGTPLDIYSFEPNYPDDPPHNTGTPLDIYDYNPKINDTPPHTTGQPLDIYNNKK